MPRSHMFFGCTGLTAYSRFTSANGVHSEGTGYGPSGGSSGGKARGDGNARESSSRGGSSSRRYSKGSGSGSGSGSASESADEPSKLGLHITECTDRFQLIDILLFGTAPCCTGCVWDGTGCRTGDCDTETMEHRCSKLSHNVDKCESEIGQYNRCVWSHGDKTAVQANELEMEPISHDSREMKQEEIPQRLGLFGSDSVTLCVQ